VDEAYLRASWRPDDLVVGVRRGAVVAHADGRVVLAELRDAGAPALHVRRVEDDGTRGLMECSSEDGAQTLEVELQRPGRLVIRRRGGADWEWWCQRGGGYSDDRWAWNGGTHSVMMRLLAGSVRRWEPEGHQPEMAVGNGLLKLHDPAPRRYPRATVTPDGDGVVAVEIQIGVEARD
jgi:hypothetical protein